MKTLLVATDFSPAAENALDYAADMAQAIEADIWLLHVFQPPVNYGDSAIPEVIPTWMQQAGDSLGASKRKIEQRTGGRLRVNTEVRVGAFLFELGFVCSRLQPIAVIMGCKGTTAAERLLFGSHAIDALKHLSWPVITVPLGASFTPFKKIGLACDLQETETSVPWQDIDQLVHDFKAELHVLNSRKPGAKYDPEHKFATGWLGKKLRNSKPVFHFLTGEAGQDLLHFAEKHGFDLLIVLPKRHSLLNTIFHSSHTKELVLHTHTPLMALHAHQEEPATSAQKP